MVDGGKKRFEKCNIQTSVVLMVQNGTGLRLTGGQYRRVVARGSYNAGNSSRLRGDGRYGTEQKSWMRVKIDKADDIRGPADWRSALRQSRAKTTPAPEVTKIERIARVGAPIGQLNLAHFNYIVLQTVFYRAPGLVTSSASSTQPRHFTLLPRPRYRSTSFPTPKVPTRGEQRPTA